VDEVTRDVVLEIVFETLLGSLAQIVLSLWFSLTLLEVGLEWSGVLSILSSCIAFLFSLGNGIRLFARKKTTPGPSGLLLHEASEPSGWNKHGDERIHAASEEQRLEDGDSNYFLLAVQ
jgi:hypothetical protein